MTPAGLAALKRDLVELERRLDIAAREQEFCVRQIALIRDVVARHHEDAPVFDPSNMPLCSCGHQAGYHDASGRYGYGCDARECACRRYQPVLPEAPGGERKGPCRCGHATEQHRDTGPARSCKVVGCPCAAFHRPRARSA
jgi:hypothetical protein